MGSLRGDAEIPLQTREVTVGQMESGGSGVSMWGWGFVWGTFSSLNLGGDGGATGIGRERSLDVGLGPCWAAINTSLYLSSV